MSDETPADDLSERVAELESRVDELNEELEEQHDLIERVVDLLDEHVGEQLAADYALPDDDLRGFQ